MDQSSESENVQVTSGVVGVERAVNSPKTSKEVWRTIKARFEAGSYVSLKELGMEFGVKYHVLRKKIYREKWNEQQRTLEYKVSQKVEEKVLKEVDQATSYLASSFKRALRLEKIADASLSQASLTNEGIPLVDLEQVDILTRSELRIHELARSALRIPSVSQLDVLSAGKDLDKNGES